MDRFGFNSVRVISGSGLHRVNKSSGQFGSFRIASQIRSIRFQVSSDSIRVISNSGQFRVGSVLGQFNFESRIEIDSTLSYTGSSLVSGRLGWVTFARSIYFPRKFTLK